MRTVRTPALLAVLLLGGCGPSSPPATAGTEGDGQACALDATYEFATSGGLTLRHDVSTLEPPETYRLRRSFDFGGRQASCTTMLPACGQADAIDTGDLVDALEAPDVTAAWATDQAAVYGRDLRPVDGGVWVIRRGPDTDGPRHITVGVPCDGATNCREIPAGLLHLEQIMESLKEQELGKAACEDLRNGGGAPP